MKYPIGIQTFEKIRKEGYAYVDKTALIYQLVNDGTYYFLSRPRRFGKSLLVSTLESYFSGQKELFKGLAIEKLETEWKQYPVLHLDLNSEKYKTEEDLDIILDDILTKWEAIYGSSPSEKSPSRRFSGIVQRAYEQTKEKVVILVDEYDKPLLQTIDRTEVQEAYRETLRGVYSVLKSQDRYIKFGLLTGVTKFSHVSIFSDLNNLEDISMNADYVDICGISEKELHANFEEAIKILGTANNLTYEEACEQLRKQYDGYHFCEETIGIYNPFSLLNAFKTKKFNDYWFATGTPTFLTKLLKKTNSNFAKLEEAEMTMDALSNIDNIEYDLIPVFFQSGYLTIKGYDKETRLYRMGYPNEEVKRAFINALMKFYSPLHADADKNAFINALTGSVREGNPEAFLTELQTMMAAVDCRIIGDKELYFQNLMFITFLLLGFRVQAEQAIINGRIDLVVKTDKFVYIFELKYGGTAEAALQQIKDKQYARPLPDRPPQALPHRRELLPRDKKHREVDH